MSFEEHPVLGFPTETARELYEKARRNCEAEGTPIPPEAEHWIVVSAVDRVLRGEVKRPDGMPVGKLIVLSIAGLRRILSSDETVRAEVDKLLIDYVPIEEIDVDPHHIASAMTFCQVYAAHLPDTGPEATLKYAREIRDAKEHDPDPVGDFESMAPGARRVSELIEAATDTIMGHPSYQDDPVLIIFTGEEVGGFTAMGYAAEEQDEAARKVLTDLLMQTYNFGRSIGVPLELSVGGVSFDQWKAARDDEREDLL